MDGSGQHVYLHPAHIRACLKYQGEKWFEHNCSEKEIFYIIKWNLYISEPVYSAISCWSVYRKVNAVIVPTKDSNEDKIWKNVCIDFILRWNNFFYPFDELLYYNIMKHMTLLKELYVFNFYVLCTLIVNHVTLVLFVYSFSIWFWLLAIFNMY
jgi:hypothetical protein